MSGRKTFVWIAAGLSLILGLLACNISVNGVAPTPATGSPSNTPIISVGPSATETTQAETQTETQARAHRIFHACARHRSAWCVYNANSAESAGDHYCILLVRASRQDVKV